jgi:hypothetical protein
VADTDDSLVGEVFGVALGLEEDEMAPESAGSTWSMGRRPAAWRMARDLHAASPEPALDLWMGTT